MFKREIKTNKGFSLAEVVVGVAVLTVLVVSVYGAYTSIFHVVYASRAKLLAVDLVNEQIELIRNLPYSEVGISGGIPSGVLQHTQTLLRGNSSFLVTTTVRNIDDPFDGTLGGSPNDTSPSDYKLVEVDIDCALCVNFKTIVVTTHVSPKNLESASTNGALIVKVFDADGNPIKNAGIHVTNNQQNPPVVIDDVTNDNGLLEIVDAPPGVDAYNITATKSGYSTDATYAVTVGNPNPTKPPATVALQQVTQLSFSIDKVSTVNVSSITPACSAVPGFHFNLSGSKTIGAGILKYNQNQVTNGSGLLSLSNMEWDSYLFTGNDGSYDIVGMNPISPLNLAPNSSQSVQIIVAPKNPKTVLVSVLDGATSLPLSGVSVTISGPGLASTTEVTGQGFINQTDWSGGPGQATSTPVLPNSTKYLADNGNVAVNAPTGDVTLQNIFGTYDSSGTLISSSFDTGTASNFQQIEWNPDNQPLAVGTPNVRLQIATNNDGGTWSFTGPDGTSGTYYTTSNQNINSSNNGNRYLRYKLFLDTASATTTPDISDVSFTFTTACTPPGQVVFTGLSSGTYLIHFSKAGYVDQDLSVPVNTAWQSQTVTMLSS